jgi:ribosome-associated protein
VDGDPARRESARVRRGERRVVQARPAAWPHAVRRVTELCLERKARDAVVLDLRGISNATDYFVIVSGESDTHVRAIAERVIEGMEAEGVEPVGVEGLGGGRWVLIDYVDAVVHIFHPATREYYRLERLWGDAPAWPVRDPLEEP